MVRRRSPTRGGAVRRISMLAVLTPLTVAASVGLLGPGPTPSPRVLRAPSAEAAEPTPLPQPLPDLQEAASVTHRSEFSPGLGVLVDQDSVAVGQVPARAWAAYDRAAEVIDAADPTCHLSWALIAAIGKVESDHGRFGGRLMTVDGVVHPALYGPRLDGTSGVSRIADTDGGRVDADPAFDRAVGPMQFIPSTWTIVGVDADGDGRRDPQDIDDASLATAVYLCGGKDDLSQLTGQRRATFRYNHSSAYVDLVLRVMNAYLAAGPQAWGVLGGPGYLPTGSPQPTDAPTPQPTFEVVPSPSPTPSTSAPPTTRPTSTALPTSTPTLPSATPSPTPAPPTVAPTTEPSMLTSPTVPAEATTAPSTEGPTQTVGPSTIPSVLPSPTIDPSPTSSDVASEPRRPAPAQARATGPS